VNPELLTLPWATLLTLAGGYAGYFIAHIGIRDHHRTIDVAFSTLVFGFGAAFVYQVARHFGLSILTASAFSFASSLVIGALWGRFGRGALIWVLRRLKISHNDDLPNAWLALFSDTTISATQLSVKLKDGTWLKCEELWKFEHRPCGPCVLGAGGDVLMYVTHQQNPGDEEFAPCEAVMSVDWGYEVTYIPKDQIARLDLRRKAN
jgi:hypothetical protein